jgi:hypothetical protein
MSEKKNDQPFLRKGPKYLEEEIDENALSKLGKCIRCDKTRTKNSPFCGEHQITLEDIKDL